MPDNNVEVVRRYVEAQKGPPEEVQAVARTLWDIDGDYYPVRKFPESRPCHGLDEISEFIGRFREAWSDFTFVVDHIVAVGDDRVLACTRMRALGRESEMKLEGDLYVSAWLRQGRLIRVEDHITLSGALRALGLEGDTLQAAGVGPIAMSANLELVKSIYADWERGDFSRTDWAHPEIEYVHADGPDAGSWNGLAGMIGAFRGMLSAWEEWRVEPQEYLELDDQRVAVPYRFTARGKASGLEIDEMRARGMSVFDVNDGRVTRIVQYMDREPALADLGLTAEGDAHD